MAQNISVLGSTGSVGTQTLEVAREEGFQISALTAQKNIAKLEEQIREFKPKLAVVYDESAAKKLKQNIKDMSVKVATGIDGLCEAATIAEADTVVTAVSGMIGLKPTLSAIKSHKNIALANKETLVAGGDLVMQEAKNQNVKILPVDSEHSAIFQCLEGCKSKSHINKLILTASGGPFFGKKRSELENVNLNEALNHPSWSMGAKITIDSATMMNKGLEIIEAVHLFDMPQDKIDVIIHRESVVHSMVEYTDGAVIAQLGTPSMKTPIRYALTYPERSTYSGHALDFANYQNLSFYKPDNETFETMDICRKAISIGLSAPVVINAANEEAVGLFLKGKIKFLEIIELIKAAQKHFESKKLNNENEIIEHDKQVRVFIKELTKNA